MKRDKLRRVVFDTNVLISAAILPNSVSRRALLYAIDHYQLVQSPETFSELSEVINRKKFDRYLPNPMRSEFLLLIGRISEFIKLTQTISDCTDPKDNKFLELAVESTARVIVSGDNDLLILHPYRKIAIESPSSFLQRPQ